MVGIEKKKQFYWMYLSKIYSRYVLVIVFTVNSLQDI